MPYSSQTCLLLAILLLQKRKDCNITASIDRRFQDQVQNCSWTMSTVTTLLWLSQTKCPPSNSPTIHLPTAGARPSCPGSRVHARALKAQEKTDLLSGLLATHQGRMEEGKNVPDDMSSTGPQERGRKTNHFLPNKIPQGKKFSQGLITHSELTMTSYMISVSLSRS